MGCYFVISCGVCSQGRVAIRVRRFFVIKALLQFVGDQDNERLESHQGMKYYLNKTKEVSPRPRNLFVLPSHTS